MRRFALSLLLIWPGVGSAQGDWTPMAGSEIRAALTGQKVYYPNAWQDFRASGKTLYNAGTDSWGNWRVEGDQYCSQWPPSDLWACYKMDRMVDEIRFVGKGNDITKARFSE